MRASFFVAIVILFLFSCKKNTPVPLNSGLFGSWEVRRVYNGNILPADSIYKPGNGNIVRLNADSTYVKYVQHKYSSKGVYHTRINLMSMLAMSNERLYFDNDTSFNYLVMLNGDLMTLRPMIPDIATVDYQKISN
ncbi:hypothetical protein [Mucilaginibacter sp.]|uniref:hypothetical protein n=1 Tax=Mucilaginibacter sp. TaxID=1882438 RepID=UPI0028417001|nr:hypothetical protein [Mucilaginibacter sp.]MDR3695819.1 hypothetical protein [Mucilaginibacter sp.]